jgi:23S rRNA pseudouridine955/2504/2580 synthase
MKTVDFRNIILFENEDYILVDKPAYLSALDERDQTVSSLKDLAREYHPEATLCHRLDKETSGVLALSKNQEAYRNLAIQFEDREVSKIYHAVSEGLHQFENEAIDQPILKQTNGFVKIDRFRGKEALTYVSTLKAFKNYTLLECKPVTGRLHQIRIHLAFLSASIAGDDKYGGHHVYLSDIKKRYNLKKDTEELPLMKRVALHAFQLRFRGLDGKEIIGQSPYPKDFAVLVKQLEKYS